MKLTYALIRIAAIYGMKLLATTKYTTITAKSLHWEIAKLLELGVKEDAIANATPQQIKDLLKGLLYLKEHYADMVKEK